MPAFQENGQFIGDAALPAAAADAEPADDASRVRRAGPPQHRRSRSCRRRSPTGSRSATPTSTAEFKRRNEKVKLAVVSFPADKFREGVDGDRRRDRRRTSRTHKDELPIPEKRKVRYALVDMQAIRERTQVSPQDVQRYYEDNQQQYSTPEQVRASHILLKTEGKDDAAVKKQAEDLLAKVKGGADFAELAKKFSEDEVEQDQGRRSRLLRQGPDGAGVRQGRVRAEAGRDQRSRQDAVRLSHHQGDR